MWQYFSGAVILGLVSSMHCVGMCGPLVFALPTRQLSPAGKKIAVVLYHTGRILTYTLFGLILGFAGRRIYLAGFQQYFSITAGILILLLLAHYFLVKKFWQPALIKKMYSGTQQLMIKLWSNPFRGKFFFLGMANGILPCGMVYLALAGALVSQRVLDSTFFMFLFGLGTLPAMVALGYFSTALGMPVRNLIRKSTPVFMVLIAVMLILRGLNLGIPFISPMLPHATGSAVLCR